MNESEKRRKELLERTRELYSDWNDPPAVHPRYRSFYHQLYSEGEELSHSTLGVRVILCLLLFAVFVMMDTKKQEFRNMDSERIVQEITTDLNIAEVWKNL